MTEENGYGTSSIKVLHGLEAVRKRPGMYIGDTDDGSGLHHMVFEAVDNSIDEALAGFCTHIEVTICKDGSVKVADNGRGIPVDEHPEEHRSAAEVVMTVLHAGGKFDSNSYKVSGGLHGVGISVVNALSDRLVLTIRRQGHVWRQVYLNGGTPEAPLAAIGDTEETGTEVQFWPSPEIFSNTTFEYGVLEKRLRELSFLNSGIKITLTDERAEGKSHTFHHAGGMLEFVQYLNKTRTPINSKVFHCARTLDPTPEQRISVEVAMQWTTEYNESVFCFTNNVPQKDGGTHLSGFRTALTSSFGNYLESRGYMSKLKISVSGEDAREGLTAVVSVKMTDPKFSSQTKDKLVSSEAKSAVNSIVADALKDFLEENPAEADAICKKIVDSALEREAVRKARELSRKSDKINLNTIPDKLATCREKDPAACELFLVEGDSAGGSAKGGRNSLNQAILPLRGKILNVEKVSRDRILSSQQIGTLVMALGCGIDRDYDINKLRYHKIIIMTDADVDGAHIRILLLTFFYRQMPELIENGYVYIAQPPLYKFQKGSQIHYVLNDRKKLDYQTNLAIENSALYVNAGAAPISGQALESLFLDYNKILNPVTMKKMEAKLQHDIIMEQMYYRLLEDFSSEAGVRSWAEGFVERLPSNVSEGVYFRAKVQDGGDGKFYPVIEHHVHGISHDYAMDANWFNSPDYSLLRSMNRKVADLVEEGGHVVINGKREVPVRNFDEAYNILLDEAIKGVKIQRYKGLGEMSAEQLSETTMDPDTRSLLKVSITDAIEADRLLSDLMGEEVDQRRTFIGQNADKAEIDL
ncbi:MAG: DNA topoisomerase (ATP-hydrolyzing) subunit B [Succinivibrionaceae bacterium]|nr:DNA topoisomerase (ATP-hydrolyzing) subunit B [Succinivibrionaceae bacterium]